MPMTTANTATDAANEWYLVFGSGPANAAGQGPTLTILGSPESAQNGQLYVLDLKALIRDKTLKTLSNSGVFTTTNSTFATTEPDSFIADPIAVDLDLGSETTGEFKTDVLYYGTSAGAAGNGTWDHAQTDHGQCHAYRQHCSMDWKHYTGQCRTTGDRSIIRYHRSERQSFWVFFGSGRFYCKPGDIAQGKHMSFYGIKEPISNSTFSWMSVNPLDLFQ